MRGPHFPSLIVGAVSALAGAGLAVTLADPDEPEFNNNETLWLHRVDGSNSLIDAPIRDDATNLWSACVDGDHYVVMLGPFIAGVGFIALSVAENYENWCPDDMSTDHTPFEENDS